MTSSAPDVVGRTLTALLRTDWGEPHDVLPGIPSFYYYAIVLEIDSEHLYELRHDGLHEWKERERLFPVNPKEHGIDAGVQFLGEKISSVAADDDGIVCVALCSGVALSVTVETGTCLQVAPVVRR